MNQTERKPEPSSNVEWKHWGKTDPLFGVATLSGREKNGSLPWTYQDFYTYGELIWSEYYPAWERYGVSTESCLEIGCGAGRITRQLIKCFREVSALDISPDMIELAEQNAPGASYAVCSGQSIQFPDNHFTAVFSCEVFQHFDNRDMATVYFDEIFRILSPGGTIMIQLPIAILPFHRIWPAMWRLQDFLWRLSDNYQQLKSRIKRWLILNRNRRPFYRLLQYDPDWLRSHLEDIGYRDVQIWIFPVTGNPNQKSMGVHLFARKPALSGY
jgi:ubiquinone/menaquinone biosynthesis C-methylase UbiE